MMLGMNSPYQQKADEAVQLAAKARDARDRAFWLNIAKAWLGLIGLLQK